jgi:ADP-ribose pyrophosphatase
MTGFSRLGEVDAHQGHIWKVVVADFESPDGVMFTRDIVRSPGAVGVVPVVFDAEGLASVVLVSQYRPPYERRMIEIPAGMRDIAGEATEATGRRELIEEAGLDAGEMHHLIDIAPSPGMTDSVTSIFLATACRPAERDLHGPEEEHMDVMHVLLDDALAMIDRGEIVDAKTVVGVLLTDRHLRSAAAPM